MTVPDYETSMLPILKFLSDGTVRVPVKQTVEIKEIDTDYFTT